MPEATIDAVDAGDAHDADRKVFERERAELRKLITALSPNTDNLGRAEDADAATHRQGRGGPVAVLGAFDVVVAHLAPHDTGVGPPVDAWAAVR